MYRPLLLTSLTLFSSHYTLLSPYIYIHAHQLNGDITVLLRIIVEAGLQLYSLFIADRNPSSRQ